MSTLDTQAASTGGEAPPGVMRARFVLGLILIATLAALAYGVQPLWPYLLDEHRRIRPWQWVFLWMGDLAALFWFVAFIVSPPASLRSGNRAHGGPGPPQPGIRAFVLSMAAAVAVDAGHSALLHYEDFRSFATARIVPAEVVRVRPIRGADGFRYYVRVRFRHAGNRVREENVRVQAKNAALLPPADRRALLAGHVPFPIRVSFEPGWPSRCWLTDAGPDDGDRIYVMSYLILLFQVAGTFALAAIAHDHRKNGQIPWWSWLHRPLPFMITCFVFFFFGTLERFGGNLHQ